MKYAIYNNQSGEIRMTLSGNGIETEELEAQLFDATVSYVKVGEAVENGSHYINLDTRKANRRDSTPATPSRAEIPADGTTPLTLSQMRANTVVTLSGPVNGSMTSEGSDTITFYAPGRYTITAQAPFPARPKEIVIHAH